MAGRDLTSRATSAALGVAAFLAALGVATLGAAPITGTAHASAGNVTASSEFVPGEVLVRFEGEQPVEKRVPDGLGVREAVKALAERPDVSYAVPNYVVRGAGSCSAPQAFVPGDEGKSGTTCGWQNQQWHILPCGLTCGDTPAAPNSESFGGIDAPGAWANLIEARRAGARGVKVAVVDSGVAYRDRGRRFRINPDFDRTRFADGYDFVEDDRIPLDENGHGTHVAATIVEQVEETDSDSDHLTGLAYNSKVIPLRVLDRNEEGTSGDLGRAIRWAADHGAKIINLSLQFPSAVDRCSEVPNICAAIRRATDEGALVIGAAGNGPDLIGRAGVLYPGGAPGVLTVAATTESGCIAEYSNFGDGVDVAAPGGGRNRSIGNEQCAKPATRGVCQFGLEPYHGTYRNFFYECRPGTSMAAAHASGAAALVAAALQAAGERAGPKRIRSRLGNTARHIGRQRYYGSGLIDADTATELRP